MVPSQLSIKSTGYSISTLGRRSRGVLLRSSKPQLHVHARNPEEAVIVLRYRIFHRSKEWTEVPMDES
jgi:hypothetical protein